MVSRFQEDFKISRFQDYLPVRRGYCKGAVGLYGGRFVARRDEFTSPPARGGHLIRHSRGKGVKISRLLQDFKITARFQDYCKISRLRG